MSLSTLLSIPFFTGGNRLVFMINLGFIKWEHWGWWFWHSFVNCPYIHSISLNQVILLLAAPMLILAIFLVQRRRGGGEVNPARWTKMERSPQSIFVPKGLIKCLLLIISVCARGIIMSICGFCKQYGYSFNLATWHMSDFLVFLAYYIKSFHYYGWYCFNFSTE